LRPRTANPSPYSRGVAKGSKGRETFVPVDGTFALPRALPWGVCEHAKEAPMEAGEAKSVLAKTKQILMAFDESDLHLSLSEIVGRTGLPKSSAHRLCSELVDLDLLKRDRNKYELGRSLLDIGTQVRAYRHLRAIAEPHLFELYARTQAGVHLTIRDGLKVRYLSRIVGATNNHPFTSVWGERPIHSTASGKAFLAFSKDGPDLLRELEKKGMEALTRRTITSILELKKSINSSKNFGYVYEEGESAIGWKALAAPVWGASEEVLATVSLSMKVERSDIADLVPMLKNVARDISLELARQSASDTNTTRSFEAEASR